MIDASHRDYTEQSAAQQASIDVLKKSAVTGLEKARENAELIAVLQKQLEELQGQAKVIQGYADAAKVMSAANTVKVANLEEAVEANQEWADKTTEQLAEIDKLYEQVMIAHFQMIADSASAAVQALKEEGATASTNAPVTLDKPIEIVAPDTSAGVTNETAE
jgi:hypothetical protein